MSKELTLDTIGPGIKRVIEYYLSHPTETQLRMASQLQISRQRISAILNNPRVIKLFPVIARRRVQSHLLPLALNRYENIISKSRNTAVAERAAGRVLSTERVLSNDGTGVQVDVKAEITLRSVQELSEIVSKAKSLPNPIIEAEIVPPKA